MSNTPITDPPDPPPIYVVSGGRGASGEQLARTALAQFQEADIQLVIVPLVRFVPAGCTGNNCWAELRGFATFFLKRRYSPGQKTFYGEFIQHVVSGEGTGGEGTTVSIRLVQ